MKAWPVYNTLLRRPGVGLHAVWQPSFPPGAPPFLPHFEWPHAVKHVAAGSVAKKVFMDGMFPVLEGHDSGPFISHSCIPHFGLTKILLFSKFKMMYTAAAVKVEKLPIVFWDYGKHPVFCEEPISSMAPGPDNNVDPTGATVRIGYTEADAKAGFNARLFDMALDAVFAKMPKTKNLATNAAQKQLEKELGRDAFKKLQKDELEQLTKKQLEEMSNKELAKGVAEQLGKEVKESAKKANAKKMAKKAAENDGQIQKSGGKPGGGLAEGAPHVE